MQGLKWSAGFLVGVEVDPGGRLRPAQSLSFQLLPSTIFTISVISTNSLAFDLPQGLTSWGIRSTSGFLVVNVEICQRIVIIVWMGNGHPPVSIVLAVRNEHIPMQMLLAIAQSRRVLLQSLPSVESGQLSKHFPISRSKPWAAALPPPSRTR